MHRGVLARGFTPVAIVIVGCFWSVWAMPNAPATHPIMADQPYAIPVIQDDETESATCDLEFDSQTTYMLCVAALGDHASEWPVQVSTIERDVDTPVAAPVPFSLPAASLTPPRREPARSSAMNVSEVHRTPAATRKFFLHVTDGPLENAASYTQIHSKLVVTTNGVCVYLDNLQPFDEPTKRFVNEAARMLADEILPDLRARLGSVRDVDGDGQFCVLVSPWLSRLQGGRTHVSGFVRGTDFLPEVPAPFGHQCDMLYLNPDMQSGLDLRTLLTHELTHAVSISQRLPDSATLYGCAAEEDWLNEAIAHVVENRDGEAWSNLDHRVARFLADPSKAPLVVPDYFRSGRWRDHGCRGATFLFLDWCQRQFGTALLPRLLQAPESGCRNLESSTGQAFEDLFRGWTVALACEGNPAVSKESMTSEGGFLPKRVGRFALRGPRTEHCWLTTDTEFAKSITLQGTTCAFLELHHAPGISTRRIRINAPLGATLQVSMFKMHSYRSDLPMAGDLQITATSVSDSNSDSNSKFARLNFRQLPKEWEVASVNGYQAVGKRFLTKAWDTSDFHIEKQSVRTRPKSSGVLSQSSKGNLTCEFPLQPLQENSAGNAQAPVFCVEFRTPTAGTVRRWVTLAIEPQ